LASWLFALLKITWEGEPGLFMVEWVKVSQREGGSSPTADCACGGLCSLEVNPATEDPPHHHVGSTHPTSVNHPGEAPAEPQAMENVIFHAAQQELRPPEDWPSSNKKKPFTTAVGSRFQD